MNRNESARGRAKRDMRYHTDDLQQVEQARQQLDNARAVVDRCSSRLDEAVARALLHNVPPTYIARAAKWSRTQVYRVKDRMKGG